MMSLLELIDVLDAHEERFFDQIAAELQGHPGYRAIQQLPGVGPTLGAVFVAEIGDVHRFADPSHLCSWAGLTPKHRESDNVVHRGHITKQGSKLVRWAAVEAIQRQPAGTKISADRQRIEARRGRNIACGHGAVRWQYAGSFRSTTTPLTRRSDLIAAERVLRPGCSRRRLVVRGRRDDRQPRKTGLSQTTRITLETLHSHNRIPGPRPVCAGPGHGQDRSSSLCCGRSVLTEGGTHPAVLAWRPKTGKTAGRTAVDGTPPFQG
ncbi:transposase [Rhodococcus opacus]|uniref:transposase n=1 Tax=Rhodococcus opacus TaxID=37919 RepID=UPI00294A6359|nr:transposase [Rhodococcus opacus]MDV6244906.1 transposase [Rhodococcus opacus]